MLKPMIARSNSPRGLDGDQYGATCQRAPTKRGWKPREQPKWKPTSGSSGQERASQPGRPNAKISCRQTVLKPSWMPTEELRQKPPTKKPRQQSLPDQGHLVEDLAVAAMEVKVTVKVKTLDTPKWGFPSQALVQEPHIRQRTHGRRLEYTMKPRTPWKPTEGP